MPTTSEIKPVFRVAVLLFPGADILDFAGPIETFCHATYDGKIETTEPVFLVETTARTKDAPISTGGGNMLVQPTMSIAETLDVLDSFDVLLVPGGKPDIIEELAEAGDGQEIQLIKRFAESGSSPKPHPRERILFSVCVGSILLGAAGVLKGMKATTHHMAFKQMQHICDEQAGGNEEGKTELIRGQRFIDAGIKDGVRILTTGGVSSGFDGTLYLIELMASRSIADHCAKVMEYTRQTGGQFD